MKLQFEAHEYWLQFAAILLLSVAIMLGLASIVRRCMRSAELASDIAAQRRDIDRLNGENMDLESSLEQQERTANSLANDVSTELQQRDKLTVTMAEVLARARVLQEQRNQYRMMSDDVKNSMSKIDGSYYGRVKSAAPSGNVSP